MTKLTTPLLRPWRPVALLALGVVAASAAEQPASFQKDIRPLLEAHCFKCHNAEKHKGGVDLTPFDSEGAVLKKYKLWRRVIEQVETQEMPPDDDKFTAQHGTMVVAGVKKTLDLLESGHPALLDPGPSLVRRLSHVEFNNAIRDLTGYDLNISQRVGLPSDSTGSNYENIAAALLVPRRCWRNTSPLRTSCSTGFSARCRPRRRPSRCGRTGRRQARRVNCATNFWVAARSGTRGRHTSFRRQGERYRVRFPPFVFPLVLDPR